MAGSSIKIGADVTQFKQGMQQAQQAAKTFGAQLKANESQFKATGDKEQYLTEKGKLLKQQLDAQKTAASNAEKALKAMVDNGVSKTSAEYQKMEQALAGAQAAMYDTEAAMNNLTVSEGKASEGASTLANSLGSINKKVSFDAVINGIDRITGGLEKAAGKVIDIGQGIWDEMMKSAQWADDTATMALMYEVPLKDLLEIQALVAGGLDTTVDAILGAQVKMRRGVGNGSIADDLAEIGVSMERVVGQGKWGPVTQLKDSVSLFWEAGQAIMNLGNEYDKEAIAQKVFGKGWRELYPLFEKYTSQEEFAAAMEATSTNTEEEVNKLGELNDAVGELKHNFEVLENKVLAGLAPTLTKASEVLSGLLERVMEYLDSPEGQQALKDMETAVSGLFEELGNIDPEQVVEGFAGVFNSIVEGLQWLDKNKELLAGVLATIVTGWAAAKITGGALQVLQLVNGLTNLGKTPTVKMPKIDGNGNGGGSGVSGNQTVTTQNVTTGTVTNETVTNMSVPNLTATSETITTSNVTTMNVANLNGYPSNPTNPTNPTSPTSPALPPGTSPTIPTLPPVTLPPLTTGGGDLYINGGGDFHITGGGDTTLNLPPPSDDYITAGPDDAWIDEPHVTGPYSRDWKAPDGPSADSTSGPNWLYLAMMKVGQIAGNLSTFDPAGAAGLMIPWLSDNTTFGKTLQRTGSVGAAASAVGSDIAAAPGKALQNWTDWSDRIYMALFGKNTSELSADVGNALKNAPIDAALWLIKAGTDTKDFVVRAAEDISETATKAVDSVKEDWNSFVTDVQTFAANVPDIVFTLRMNMDKSSDRWGFDSSWFNQPGSAFTPVQNDRHNLFYANGLFSVPWDGYPAILHKGERVVPERAANYNSNIYFGNVNLNNGLEIEALTDSIDRRNRRQRKGYGA